MASMTQRGFGTLTLYGLLAAGVVIAALLVRDHFQTARLNAAKRDNANLEARLANELKLKAIAVDDARKAQEASHAVQTRLADIERDARERPITGVRLCTARPAMSASSGTAAGTSPALAGREPQPPAPDLVAGPDISRELEDLVKDCGLVHAVAQGWQEWNSARSH